MKVSLYPFNKTNHYDTCLGKRNLIFDLSRVNPLHPIAIVGGAVFSCAHEGKEGTILDADCGRVQTHPVTLPLLWSLDSDNSVGVICVFVHFVLILLLF